MERAVNSEASNPAPQLPVLGIVVLLGVWLGVSGLVVGAWLRPVVPGGWWTVLGLLSLLAVPIHVLVSGFGGGSYPTAAVRLWVMRPFWYVMLMLPVVAVVSLIGGAIGLAFGAGMEGGRWGVAAGALGMGVAAVWGYVDSRRLEVKRMVLSVAGLPEAFDGMRVVQISDTHVGPQTRRSFLRGVRDAVEGEAADLIAVTGDQVDDFSRDVGVFNEEFGGMEAPLGVFAVAGNHDVYAGWDEVRAGLEEGGFRVLVNESVAVERDGQKLWVAGTGDPAATGAIGTKHAVAPDIGRTLAEVPAGAPVLVLAHNPVLWPELAERGAALTLSGHTHYGQLAIPGLGWSLASPFLEHAMGVHRRGGATLYIHPGTNFWGIPFRLGTPPQVAVITLAVG